MFVLQYRTHRKIRCALSGPHAFSAFSECASSVLTPHSSRSSNSGLHNTNYNSRFTLTFSRGAALSQKNKKLRAESLITLRQHSNTHRMCQHTSHGPWSRTRSRVLRRCQYGGEQRPAAAPRVPHLSEGRVLRGADTAPSRPCQNNPQACLRQDSVRGRGAVTRRGVGTGSGAPWRSGRRRTRGGCGTGSAAGQAGRVSAGSRLPDWSLRMTRSHAPMQ